MTDDRKLPDELVERAAKLTLDDLRMVCEHGYVHGHWPSMLERGWNVWCKGLRIATLADLIEVVLSEGGTTQRFCLYHGATAVSDPETAWCRIADRSNPKSSAWCKVVEVAVFPLERTENATVTNRPAEDS